MTRQLKCGLLGKVLGHSYSPEIHALLGGYSYSLFEVAEDDLGEFLASDSFDALNVTIPYKKAVMPYLSEISAEAERIGAVNTITRLPGGELRGDNTDYYGFSYLLDSAKIDVRGKKVVILGSGGASVTVQKVVEDRGAEQIIVVSRSGENNYENISRHADCDVLINTTPVGMYPNNGRSPVSLDVFDKLSGVADIIYNPSKTALVLDAEERKIPCASGLTMLVAQAKLASELFTGSKIDDKVIDNIVHKISVAKKNVMLIGMPGCGKSTAGRSLAQLTGREFYDTDELVAQKSGMTIPEIFATYGEKHFRRLETEALAQVSKLSSAVIATGGGIVMSAENRRLIRENSVAVFLRRDISVLEKDGRPISQSSDMTELYKNRLPYYEMTADISVNVEKEYSATVDNIKRSAEI